MTWFAGLFYLPRLFVYHAMSDDQISIERFKIMERKLYFGIMTPGMVLTLVFGIWMLTDYAWTLYHSAGWLPVKLILVGLLVAYHAYCGHCVREFKFDRNPHHHVFFRWLNEVPVLFLFTIILLATLKPF